MRILIVGAGSTGGFLGAKLAKAGRDIIFLVRPQRLIHLEQNGLSVRSTAGDIVSVHTHSRADPDAAMN
jgi:2-dehydropantoate 2-reductase